MSRFRTLALVLILFLAFVLLELLIGSRTALPSPERDHSSLNTNRWGTMALQEVCARLGLRTQRWGAAFRPGFLRPQETLLLLDPQLVPTPDEYRALWESLRSGATLILALSGERRDLPLSLLGSVEAKRWRPELASELTLAYLGLTAHPTGTATRLLVPQQARQGVLAGVGAVDIPSARRLRPGVANDTIRQQAQELWGDKALPLSLPGLSARQTLLQDSAGRVLVRFTLDRGLIYVLSEVETFSNERLGQADNAVLAVNLIFSRGRPGRVLFDEYHHGVLLPTEMPTDLNYHAFWVAMGLALLALMIYLAGYGWRLGRPAPAAEPPRRSVLEYVAALASLYQAARAGGLAVNLIAGDFRRRLAERLRLPASAPDDLLVQVARRRGPATSLEFLLRRLATLSAEDRLPDAEVVRLVRTLSDIEEALFPHG